MWHSYQRFCQMQTNPPPPGKSSYAYDLDPDHHMSDAFLVPSLNQVELGAYLTLILIYE